MRLLIVSSQYLNPADIFSSTFELSQAKILSRFCEVAILSVGERPCIRTEVRRLVRALVYREGKTAWDAFRLLWRSFFDAGRVAVHKIEGITVYEGFAPPLDLGKLEAGLKSWTGAALRAFASYRRSGGLPDLVHAHGRFLCAGLLALQVKKDTGVPYIYTEHSSFFSSGLAPPELRALLKEVVDQCSVYTAVSGSLVREVEKFLGVPIPNALILPNALDEMFETFPLSQRPADGKIIFLNVASLRPIKGIDILLRAFSRAFHGDARYELRLCGDGPLQAELASLAEELGIRPQVTFVGFLDKPAVVEEMDRADIIVLSSLSETFGVVLIEAMARGRPVVGTMCGGPAEIVAPQCGLLVPPNDVAALAQALETIAADRPRYQSAEIREYSLFNYGSMSFLDSMRTVYDRALGKVA